MCDFGFVMFIILFNIVWLSAYLSGILYTMSSLCVCLAIWFTMSRASVLSIVNFTLYILCCLASFISLTAFFPIIMLIFLFNMLLLVLFFSCLSSALVSSSPTIFSCYCPLFPRTLMLFIQPATIFCFQPAVPFSAPLLCFIAASLAHARSLVFY